MSQHTVKLRQQHDYQFEIDFGDGGATLRSDLPPPTGAGGGPSPEHLLAAAVANCLAASLLFALRKYKQSADPLACEVTLHTGRNAEKRLRVLDIQVRITLGVPAEAVDHLERILGSFEDFCTVTASVRAAIPVHVQVFDAHGAQLK